MLKDSNLINLQESKDWAKIKIYYYMMSDCRKWW
jgi:hypothetical protein